MTTHSDGAFLERNKWNRVSLCDIKQINHDSYLYRFALPNADQQLGLPVGQHVFVRLRRKDTGEMVQRAYTPVSQQGAVGFIEFLIKCISSTSTSFRSLTNFSIRLYLPSALINTGGKMTTGFHQLCLGDSVELKGPLGSFILDGPRTALWKGIKITVKEVGMICGGSGTTLNATSSVILNKTMQGSRLSSRCCAVFYKIRKLKPGCG
jgi:nitrate reductase (NAD(P)H)